MNKNKILKTLGNSAVVLSLAFICKKLYDLDIDTSVLFRADNLVHVAWISILYGLHMVVLCVPWKVFIRIFSGRNVPFTEAAWVLNKSNLMKYLPGNIFQFIGRNELAVRLNLRHADVAFATVCDLGLVVAVNLMLSTILNWQGITAWFGKYGFSSLYFLLGILTAAGITIFFLKMKRKNAATRNVMYELDTRLKKFLTWRSLNNIFACLLYLTLSALCIALLFLVILVKMLQVNIANHDIPVVLSAYMFSWVVGFIAPGAPGGIGIRETTLTLFLAGVVPIDDALLAAIIFRFISIIADFWGFLFAWIGTTVRKR